MAWALAALLILSSCGMEETGDSGQTDREGQEEETLNIKDLEREGVIEPGVKVDGRDGQSYLKTQARFFDVFDTVVDVTFFTKTDEEFDRLYKQTKKDFVYYHKLFDNFHEYDGINNVMTINQAAGKEPVKVEDDLFKLIEVGVDTYDKLDGKVNIAMGSVIKLWHEKMEKALASLDEAPEPGEKKPEGSLPDPETLKEAGQHMDINKVVLDKDKKTVYLEDPDMSLDLGAIAKGYATELVGKHLEEAGLKSGIISAGGNVRLVGQPVVDRDRWLVGIADPKEEKANGAAVVSLKGPFSLATSGDYERYFYADGKRYHHIIDPESLYPKTYFPSVTILTEDAGLADLLSTACFLSNKDQAEEILKRFPDKKIDILWLDRDDNVSYSQGLKGLVEEQ